MAKDYVTKRPVENFDPATYNIYEPVQQQVPMLPEGQPVLTQQPVQYVPVPVAQPQYYPDSNTPVPIPQRYIDPNTGELIQGTQLDQMHSQPVGESGQTYVYPLEQRAEERSVPPEQKLSQRIAPSSPLVQPPIVKTPEDDGTYDLAPLPSKFTNRKSEEGSGAKFQKTIDQQDKRTKKMEDIYGRGVGMQQRALKEQGKFYDQLGQDLKDSIANEQASRIDLQNTYTQKFNDMMKDLDDEYEGYKNERIEKSRLFRDMGTGRRILSGIGLFMSAFSNSAMKNSVNIIERAIARDIQAQKDDLSKKQFFMKGKQNKLAYLMSKYNSDVLATQALGALDRKKVVDLIDSQIKRARTDQEIGKLESFKAEFMKGIQGNIAKMSDFQKSFIYAQWKSQRSDPIAKKINLTFMADDQERRLATQEYADWQRERNVLTQVNSVYNDALKEGPASLFSGYWPLGVGTSKRKTMFAQLFGPIKALIQEAVQKGEIETIGQFVPLPSDTKSQVLYKMKSFQRALINNYKQKVYLPQALGQEVWNQMKHDLSTGNDKKGKKGKKTTVKEKKPVF